ncbi:MAG: AAA family ATPase [Bacteroidota bacterium]
MRIKQIEIKDFKAFAGEYPSIKLDGKSLLVYGENGSGKSSLAQALDQFVETSTGMLKFGDFKNIFAHANDGFVKLTCEGFDAAGNPDPENGIYEWSETSDMVGQDLFVDASKTKGFLDYKRSLAVYLHPKDANRIDVFDLLMRNLLSRFVNPVSRSTFGDELGVMEQRVRAYWYQGNLNVLKRHLRDFNAGLSAVLKELNTKASDILTEFETGVTIRLAPARLSYGRPPKRLKRSHIGLFVQYYGRKIHQPHLFLNEARLSAVAISIFLGSMLIQPSSKIKLLILDDMLIGLDFSNRMPLLNVLKKHFNDYQVFMLTFDRNWFEIAKALLANGWGACEMYVSEHKEGPVGAEVVIGNKPQIVQPSDSYLDKAKKYFEAFDYPAAANYLRKRCEELIDDLLPLSYKIEPTNGFGSREITKLDGLIDRLKMLFEDCEESAPRAVESLLRLLKKATLNPMSHHDLESPIYRVEVEQLFDLVDELANLPRLKRQICLKAGSRAAYHFTDATREYSIDIELVADLLVITVNGNSRFNKAKWKIATWALNGVEFSSMDLANHQRLGPDIIEKTCAQERHLEGIANGVFGPRGLAVTPPRDVLAEFKVTNGGTLRDLLE